MKFGKQEHFCLNCGIIQYDSNLSMDHVLSQMCSDFCREEYRMKYARMIIGKDQYES